MNKVYYNPCDMRCKSITGGIPTESEVCFNLFNCNENGGSDLLEDNYSPTKQAAFFVLNRDGEEAIRYPMQNTAFGWQIRLKINERGLYYYRFHIEEVGDVCENADCYGELNPTNGHSFLLTVYDNSYQTPEWFKGGVMYQIFPDRFAKSSTPDITIMPDIVGRVLRDDWGGTPSYQPNSQGKVLNNDFFGGNFKGVEEKLPYLKDLGVTVIYFNPIFEAASNHRYDTSDYLKIDPILGTKEDFEHLVESAKKQGIRVILDGVFNHTGDDSVYFNKYGRYSSLGAYQSKDSPYYSWYDFQVFPDKYRSWWGIDILPETNENSPEYQEFIFGKDGVLKTWLKSGIGGYRLDVADELPDFFLKKLRESVKSSDKNAIIIGEVWEDASDKVAYSERRKYLQGFELDSVMNYPWKDGIIDYILSGNVDNLIRTIRALMDHYPKVTLDCLMNILGTHDTARILTVLGGVYCQNKDEMAQKTAYLTPENKEIALQKLKMASVLQFTLPGVPCIYYGDENGMEGHIDPFCRRCFDWEHTNKDLFAHYQALSRIREEYHDIFSTGRFEEVHTKDGLFIYKRSNHQHSIYIYTNNSQQEFCFEKQGKRFKNLLNDNELLEKIKLTPNSFGIFEEIL